MTIRFDSDLPPLHPKEPPVIPVETLLSIDSVTLAARDTPRGVLKEFYCRILGLTFVEADAETVRFTYQQRRIVLDRNQENLGRLGLLIRNFGEALERLRAQSIPYELLHSDGGLSRVAIVRDPAGNWVHLLETRPF